MINMYINPITGLKVYHKTTQKGLNLYVAESIVSHHKFEMIVKYGSAIKKYCNSKKDIVDIIPGTAHLIEHLAFKPLENDTENLLEYFKNRSIYVNAYTSLDRTVYVLESRKSLLNENCLEKYIKNILNPNYTNTNIKNELKIIESEYIAYKRKMGNYTKVYINLLKKLGLEKNNIGEIEPLTKNTPEGLKKIHDMYYTPKNTSLVYYINPKNVNAKPEEILKLMERVYLKNSPKILKRTNKLNPNVDTIDDTNLKDENAKELRWLKIYKDTKRADKLKVSINILNDILLDELRMHREQNEINSESGLLAIFSNEINGIYTNIIIAAKYEDSENIYKDLEYIKNVDITEDMLSRAKRSLLRTYIRLFDYEEDHPEIFTAKGNVFNQINILKDMTLKELIKMKKEILNTEDYIEI